MKSTLTILTLVVAGVFATRHHAMAQQVTPQPVTQGMIAIPVPVAPPVQGEFSTYVGDLGSQQAAAYSTHVGDLSAFATHVGDDGEAAVAPPDPGYLDGGYLDGGYLDTGYGGKGKCGGDCDCPACRHSRILNRAFISVEYLHWWNKGRKFPPLVTTDSSATPINSGPPNFTPIALTVNNSLNNTAQVLFGGDQEIGDGMQAGGRITGGIWDDCHSRALGIRVYGNEGHTEQRLFASDGSQPLGIPYFNTDPLVNAEDALIVAHNNFGLNRAGNISITAENEVIGGEVFLRSLLDSGCNYRLDMIGGYRFNRINDEFLMQTFIDDRAAGDMFRTSDLFDASNEFNAGELGLLAEFQRGCWRLMALGKVAVGNMNQRVVVAGFNSTNMAPPTAGGIYTQPTNIGVYERDITAWSPEANFKLSYAVNDRISFTLGYTFIYWTRVALAGDQMDRNLNSTQFSGMALTGPPDPRFRFGDTDFWVQTIDVGVAGNY